MAIKAKVLGGKSTVALDEGVFGVEVNEALLHEVVKAEAAAKRQGTHATKSRGEVAGGRAKPWRQKGTGRARQGTTRAGHWRGGGTIFGPHPRSYHLKVNRKAYRRARAIALSVLASRDAVVVFDASSFETPRTKDAIALLGAGYPTPIVIVVSEDQSDAALSFRNIPRSLVITPHELEVTHVLWARQLVFSTTALDQITTMLTAPVRSTEEVAA